MNGSVYVDELNRAVKNNAAELVNRCEQRFKNEISRVVDAVYGSRDIRLVMLAGPSSSGKTTTAAHICREIAARGRPSKRISLDDFYLDQNERYYFEDGTPDFETIKALDLELIKSCLNGLILRGRCLLPQFSFETGNRKTDAQTFELEKDEVVVVEGLHAINPLITGSISGESVLKAYVSVSSRVYDSHSVLLTRRELRLIRRLIRDHNFRFTSAQDTLFLWGGVLTGEDRYIFPFKGLSDIRINSMHEYEPCLFRREAERLLGSVEPESEYYSQARSLLQKLERFEPLECALLPADSLLREFIG